MEPKQPHQLYFSELWHFLQFSLRPWMSKGATPEVTFKFLQNEIEETSSIVVLAPAEDLKQGYRWLIVR